MLPTGAINDAALNSPVPPYMPRKNYDFGFPVRTAMRLREMESILKETRVIVPVPSRPALIALIESGALVGIKRGRLWLVYEDSFHQWVKSYQPEGWEPIEPSVLCRPISSK